MVAKGLLGAGITLACAMMAPRVLLQVSVVRPSLLPYVIFPIGVLGAVPLAFSLNATHGAAGSVMKDNRCIQNPLAINAALALVLVLLGFDNCGARRPRSIG